MASSDGIGKAIACSLAHEGVHVMMCGRDEAKLASAMDEAKSVAREGARVAGERIDLGTPDGPALLVEAAATAFGGLDILVTNTGGPPAGPLLGFDDEAWQSAFESVLLSVARGARAAQPYLAASEQGRIVAIASSSIKFSLSGLGFSNVSLYVSYLKSWPPGSCRLLDANAHETWNVVSLLMDAPPGAD